MKFIVQFERILNALVAPLERFSHQFLLAPIRFLIAQIDPLAERIKGTLFKKILQVTIYPLFMTLTIIIGFKMVENGIQFKTFTDTVLMFLVFGAIFAPLERLIPWSKRWQDDKELPTDWFLFFGGKLWGDYINKPLRIAATAWIVQEISPEIGKQIWPTFLNPVVQVFLLLSINDFFRYWYHRWMHENEFMWRWHSVHHSSERLYWFNASRSHPLEGLVSSIIWAIPFALIKAPAEIVFVTNLLGRTIGRFQHTNLDLKVGIFDYIFSTPKNHRYHHSKSHIVGHTNYGGDVIIWDLLFGTFYLPKGEEPSDDIGIEELPNYPKSFVGLMFAPFIYGRLKKEALKLSEQNKDT
jgi:sterol desaturase/sphingolipid hydroxylase (fatty acid hydroxylase superfamily)